MAKASKRGGLKRSERREPEVHLEIKIQPDDSGESSSARKSSLPGHVRHVAANTASTRKRSRAGTSSKARVKVERGIENAAKLARKAESSALRKERKRRAKE
ncbi:hypothetical protein CBOM_06744 [Ceraceosorus bombacis]|uniref:Uncharacterized protein n=1 Tax=Ceraceosorus bombacis TaxID=401625 RepID=A0A0P1BRA4_9BASI|nr:hypothetical protein CBOM_06744 [Ceraceosorus bombacis]